MFDAQGVRAVTCKRKHWRNAFKYIQIVKLKTCRPCQLTLSVEQSKAIVNSTATQTLSLGWHQRTRLDGAKWCPKAGHRTTVTWASLRRISRAARNGIWLQRAKTMPLAIQFTISARSSCVANLTLHTRIKLKPQAHWNTKDSGKYTRKKKGWLWRGFKIIYFQISRTWKIY